MDTIILFGLKGSGKSYFGRLLAQKLQVPLIDTDDSIQSLYEARFFVALSCREIFLKQGASFFRSLENEVVLALERGAARVIALGGGALLNPQHAKHLATIGRLVYLKANQSQIKQRLLQSPLPSFLDPSDFDGSFERMIQARLAIYEALHAPTIDLHGKSDQAIVEELEKLGSS